MFGYMNRDASEAVHAATWEIPECQGAAETAELLGCLALYGD